ncbi:M28 family peptidase [Sinanaerobacter chloroacetimidivorans]|uniref:Carboxypeptidase Q n=1 Tax=Sinanaerobacter chloroacetimidivorans TaxID=2818044 RepID=A0A8J8B248_9FIRM|nr:M28 family peptidase [Sinanaerobacter chloroacetimidivorans]MBR0598914.1 M28 family peptidase [Sinanaerobacter chloroacetimidivorans]
MKRKILSFIVVLALIGGSFGFAFADTTYVVKDGDVLWKIANQYETTWQTLAEYNKLTNPNLIYVNQKINIPDGKGSAPAPIPAPAPVPEPVDEGVTVPAAAQTDFEKFIAAVDQQYAYSIALELSTNPKYMSSSIGSRTAGSDAEHAAADYLLSEMKRLGLAETEKVATDVTKWQFNGASLTFAGDDKVILPHSYATGATPKNGITAEVVFVGDGTMYDYEDIDVKGKIVLIDLDQRANWWITYPMLEAEFQGAAAIMSANVGGFAQVSKDALNSQDICGPVSIPCVSISVNDSDYIKAKLEKGPVTATLKVDNVVQDGGTSYNIMGKIKGKSSDQQIIIGGHYDMYFKGFQDDNCAVGLVLAMAKAMKDSGFVPENDIVFCIHGAEEWGSTYSMFDWTTGAWNMINKKHPEWAGKTLAFVNFELPAYEFGSYTSVYSAPELYSMIDYYVNKYPLSPKPVNCFPDGVKTEGYQTYTYSDDFSYYAAGVPSTVNGFLLQEDMETVFPFYIERYHSQFDDPGTYDKDVMDFNIKFYGALVSYIDRTPALFLDFTSQYDRLLASLDENIAAASGIDTSAYKNALSNLKTAAESAKQKVTDINTKYNNALISGIDPDSPELIALKTEAKALNAKNLKIFKYVQDEFLGLMYERPIVPHEAPQENILLMQEIVKCLKAGDVVTAADEYAWQVNNILEWYSMYFSPEVINIQNDMFWGKNNQNNLFWGTNKNFTPADVEAATRGLMEKYEAEKPDVTAEIAVYEKAIQDQKVIYKNLITKETAAIKKLTEMLQ